MPGTLETTQPGTQVATGRRGEHRADIQALRALAVASVLLYHLWPNRLPGGYVGVDVFFVISGYLITSHLLREIARTGTVHVGRFWARRATRLLPASLTVLLATAIAVMLFVPDAWWRQFLRDIVASTVYVENWQLAADAVDYLALGNAASPTQHFWTLSAEEQFYIALPLLLVAVLLPMKRRPQHARRATFVVVSAAVVSSLAYSIWLTVSSPSVAYFSTFTRAWEFGAGALLAYVGVRAGSRATRLLPVLGVALIAIACVFYSAATPFPGYAAALPVAGTLLVLWAGRASVVARVGLWRPVAVLGRISYAVYLWHWPLVVLVPYVTGRPLSTIDKVAILVATLALAWLSTNHLEDPIRFSPRLLGGRRSVTVGAWCGAAMAVVIAISSFGIATVDARDRARAELFEALKADPPPCFGAAAMDSDLAPCENPELSGILAPDVAVAGTDDDNLPECWGMASGTEAKLCTVADPEGHTKRLLAVGDSHSNTLIGAYRIMAENRGWQMDVAGTPGCYLTTATQASVSDAARETCEAWRESVVDVIRADPPDALIVTHSSGDNLVLPAEGETVEQATIDGLVEAWSMFPDLPIVVIRDNPEMTAETAGCVARFGLEAAHECDRPRAEALGRSDGQAEAAAQVPNARLVDLTQLYCSDDACSPVIGNVLVYRDARHLTATWARTLTPYLEREVVRALGW